MSRANKALKIKHGNNSFSYARTIINMFFNNDMFYEHHHSFKRRVEDSNLFNALDVDTESKERIEIMLPSDFTEIIDEMAIIISHKLCEHVVYNDYDIYSVSLSRDDLKSHRETFRLKIKNLADDYKKHDNTSFFIKELQGILFDIEDIVLSYNGQKLIKIPLEQWYDDESIFMEFMDDGIYSKYHKKAKSKVDKLTSLIISEHKSGAGCALKSLQYSEYFRVITMGQMNLYLKAFDYIYSKKEKIDNKL